jgi:TM2 domain-containing membrane protein YozV
MARSQASPNVAAVLSLFIPGVGQIYAGHFVWGIVWLFITPGLWIGTGGMLGWICHILASMQAFNQARRG